MAPRILHPPGQAGGGAVSVGGDDCVRSASNGLVAAQTLLVARQRYRAVVFRLRWPSRSWIVRTSAPLSSMWTAKAWRNECGVIGLPIPTCSRTMRQTVSTAQAEIG